MKAKLTIFSSGKVIHMGALIIGAQSEQIRHITPNRSTIPKMGAGDSFDWGGILSSTNLIDFCYIAKFKPPIEFLKSIVFGSLTDVNSY